MADLSAVAVDGVPMQLVPLLRVVRAGRDARHGESVRVDAAGVSAGKSGWREPRRCLTDFALRERAKSIMASRREKNKLGQNRVPKMPKGAFYEARVCSDADLLSTVLNMLERM